MNRYFDHVENCLVLLGYLIVGLFGIVMLPFALLGWLASFICDFDN